MTIAAVCWSESIQSISSNNYVFMLCGYARPVWCSRVDCFIVHKLFIVTTWECVSCQVVFFFFKLKNMADQRTTSLKQTTHQSVRLRLTMSSLLYISNRLLLSLWTLSPNCLTWIRLIYGWSNNMETNLKFHFCGLSFLLRNLNYADENIKMEAYTCRRSSLFTQVASLCL